MTNHINHPERPNQANSNIHYVGESQVGEVKRTNVQQNKETMKKSSNENFQMDVKQTNLQVGVPSAKDLPSPTPKESLAVYTKQVQGLQALVTGNFKGSGTGGLFKFYLPPQADNIFAIAFKSNYLSAQAMQKSVQADWAASIKQNMAVIDFGTSTGNAQLELGKQEAKAINADIISNYTGMGFSIASGALALGGTASEIGESIAGSMTATEDGVATVTSDASQTGEVPIVYNADEVPADNVQGPGQSEINEENPINNEDESNPANSNDKPTPPKRTVAEKESAELKERYAKAGRMGKVGLVLKSIKTSAWLQKGAAALVGNPGMGQQGAAMNLVSAAITDPIKKSAEIQKSAANALMSNVQAMSSTTQSYNQKTEGDLSNQQQGITQRINSIMSMIQAITQGYSSLFRS
ncbi:MAG: hypothetical protein JHC93_02695 [Parachlamydiales bacterium]|nr:hypothetical protein [Parachlamydiales bacterium]